MRQPLSDKIDEFQWCSESLVDSFCVDRLERVGNFKRTSLCKTHTHTRTHAHIKHTMRTSIFFETHQPLHPPRTLPTTSTHTNSPNYTDIHSHVQAPHLEPISPHIPHAHLPPPKQHTLRGLGSKRYCQCVCPELRGLWCGEWGFECSVVSVHAWGESCQCAGLLVVWQKVI